MNKQCAQCQKQYRQGGGQTGCPKCAPGTVITESDFREPIAQPAPVPLTDEQIDALWVCTPEDQDGNDFVPFARAIERAHGIVASREVPK